MAIGMKGITMTLAEKPSLLVFIFHLMSIAVKNYNIPIPVAGAFLGYVIGPQHILDVIRC